MKIRKILSALFILLGIAWNAQAALEEVGPVVEPAGYPWFYKDASGLELQLCLDQNGFCLTAEPDPTQPISFPDNFGDEVFWWSADALAPPLVANGKALLVMGLEGAFGGTGVLQDGQQISFGRVRIRVDVPEAGNYRIIHPFGEVVFNDVTVADGINYTADIGSINALNPALGFSGALQAEIGPFLTWPDYDDPLINPGLQVPVLDNQGVPTGEVLQYVGDPNIPHVVVGSPTGDNVFRIQKQVGGDWETVSETDFFTISGKVLPAGATQPVAWVFPDAPPQNLFAVGAVNRDGAVGGISPQQPEGVRTGTLLSGYPVGFPLWYQDTVMVTDPVSGDPVIDPLTGVQQRDPGLQLTLCPGVDPMCISAPVDPASPASVALQVGDEAFWWSADAFINDRTADIAPQDLPAGLDGTLVLALEAAFGGTGAVQDGNQIAFGRLRIRIDTPVAGNYRVTHPFGEELFDNVPAGVKAINITRDIGVIDPAAPDEAFVGALFSEIGPRFLAWDTFDTDPLLNDPLLQKVFDPTDLASPVVQYLGDPAVPHAVQGSAIPDGGHSSGFQNYFRIQGPNGIDVQTSLFTVTGKVYDPATFRIVPNPAAPVAQDDAATTQAGSPVVVNVLANDTLDGNAVDAAATTVTILPAGAAFGPNSGTVAVNADKTLTYTPDPGLAGTDSFAYQITVDGLISNVAVVTATVTPLEEIAVRRAELDLRRLQWKIQGTDNLDGAILTLHAGPTVAGPVIGTALVSRGKWEFRGRATSNPGVTTISVSSSTGKTLLNQPLRIR